MKIITVSREFGSGGRELGKRLAENLGFDYYDREIITEIAKKEGISSTHAENVLSDSFWKSIPLNFSRSFYGVSMMQNEHVNLLLAQNRVIEEIARLGKDCVIVGRNADVVLKDYNPFNIFVCADMEAKISRCFARADDNEKLSEKEMEQNIRRIDKNRAHTRELIGGGMWGNRESYHLIVNTTDWNIKELTPAVAEFAVRWFGRTK